MRQIVVIGSNGQLGSELVALCGELGVGCKPLTHADIDISDAASVRRALSGLDAPIDAAQHFQ